jgi:hypothetical protein
MESGGGKGIRTPGLFIANEALYQLSYTPNSLSLNDLHDFKDTLEIRLDTSLGYWIIAGI